MRNYKAYVGIGSNLHQPVHQVQHALQALKALPATQQLAHSSLYRSAPLGPKNQPNYINAVAVLSTTLSPWSLLEQLQQIENQQGRVRGPQRWGPRTLDLDLLLYDHQEIQELQLTLPHQGLYDRAFVLYPLYECAPTLILPNGQPLSDLIRCCSAEGLEQL